MSRYLKFRTMKRQKIMRRPEEKMAKQKMKKTMTKPTRDEDDK